MNFREWLKLYEVGTMSSTPTGGVGDVAQFKLPMGGMVRRTWPYLDDDNYRKKRKKR